LADNATQLGLYLLLVHDRRITEAWLMFRSAVDIAMAVGLHRNDTRLRLDPYLSEYRARLWSYLCHADATLSCLVGIPLSIDPATYDVLTVNNINLQDLVALSAASGDITEIPSRPLEEPTFATYLIFRRKLATIVARMVSLFQKVKKGSNDDYDEVMAIDTALTEFRNNLPPVFQFSNPDKSRDNSTLSSGVLFVFRHNLADLLQLKSILLLNGTTCSQRFSTMW